MTHEYIVVWFNHPQYKGVDQYFAYGEENGVSSDLRKATKFASRYEVKEYFNDRELPEILDEGHLPKFITRLDIMEAAREEAEAMMQEWEYTPIETTHLPDDTFKDQMTTYIQSLLGMSEEKVPCNESCPICGSRNVDRLYCHEASALFETESYRVQPEIGKIHNGCACCEHEWLSDPLPSSPEAN